LLKHLILKMGVKSKKSIPIITEYWRWNEINETTIKGTSSTPKVSTVQNNNTTNTVIIDMTKRSVLNYTNFGLTTENFPRWFRALKRHLTALKLIQYINVKIDPMNMDETQNEDITQLNLYWE